MSVDGIIIGGGYHQHCTVDICIHKFTLVNFTTVFINDVLHFVADKWGYNHNRRTRARKERGFTAGYFAGTDQHTALATHVHKDGQIVHFSCPYKTV
jgi:lysylphosphatidylglycerol synthetase-like protein (DUF2156 family)